MNPRRSPIRTSHRRPTRSRSACSLTLRAGVAATSFALFGVLAACSSSTEVTGDTTATSTSTSVASTTTVAASTTTSTVAPSTVPATTEAPATTAVPTTAPAPEGCAVDFAPTDDAVGVEVVNGDWNGDGDADSALSWGEPIGSGIDWYVRMQNSGGVNSVVALGDLGVGFAAVVGPVDVDFSLGAPPGSNRDELLAIVGSNAAGFNLGVFGTDGDGCAFQFDGGGGDAYVIPIHGAAATMSGLMCDGGMGSQFIVRLEASTTDGAAWDVRYIRVERSDGNTLVDGTILNDVLPDGDPQLELFSKASCGGTDLVGGDSDF
ncbi:MAG: hypothetical protein Q7V88_12885 [Actinomycetota bacterium]|nr:hypothetical protein [Actinomycetota bacterium]